MKLKKYLLRYSVMDYLHFILTIFLLVLSFFVITGTIYLEKKLSSAYFLIFQQLCNFSFFLFYQILIILFMRIDFGKIEINRIKNLINLSSKNAKKINYANLAKLRTFCFYSPAYFNFIYIPIILSLSFPLYKNIFNIYEILKYGSVAVIRTNLLILIGINFLAEINSILIYLYFGLKKSFIYIISLLLSLFYRFLILYFSSLPSFNAIYTIIFIFNLLFNIILLFLTINQNIRSNVYAD